MLNKYLNIVFLLVIVFLALLLLRTCNKKDHLKNFEDMYNASQDTLHTTRDVLGRETASKAILYGDVDNLKKINKELAAQVNKNTISATIIRSSTGGVFTSTTTITRYDTVFKQDTLIVLYPEYHTRYENQWENFDITATKDTFLVNYKVFNKFSIKQEWKRDGLFKPKKPIISVFNENPHTSSIDIQSFVLKENKPKKWAIFGTGVLAGLVSYKLLSK